MTEIRLHGRGGQGTVTAAELIAEAAFYDGKFAQAFPSFGIERRGAPVEAFVRISDQPILLRSQIYEPDYLIIQDASLISAANTFRGAKKNTFIIINTEKEPKKLFSQIAKSQIAKRIKTDNELIISSNPHKIRSAISEIKIRSAISEIKNIKIQTVPATQIALEILGKPIINTVLLGAFAGASILAGLAVVTLILKTVLEWRK